MKQNKVSLLINGERFEGWKSVKISVSIEQLARAFAVSVTDKFPGDARFRRIRPGDRVELFIDDEKLCTGYVTSTPISYSGMGVSVNVQGKSKTVDLVDCCPPLGMFKPAAGASSDESWAGIKRVDGKQVEPPPAAPVASTWRAMPVAQIIATLAAAYGVKLKTQTDLGSQVSRFSVTPGDSVFGAIQKLIHKDNLVVSDDVNGDLLIVDAGRAGRAHDALVCGENVLDGQCAFDASRLYSDYVCVGQHSGSDTDFAAGAAEDRGAASSALIQRKRILVLKDTGQSSSKTCAERAQFESRYRAAQFMKTNYRVAGWRQGDDSLWRVNSIVHVEDSILGFNRSMLVVAIEFSLSPADGMTTRLTVIPPEGYRRDGQKEQSDDKKTDANPFEGMKKIDSH